MDPSETQAATSADGHGSASRRVALVTGAASGLGRELAGLLAERGEHVVLADLDEERGRAAAAALTERGMSAEPARLDVRDGEAVESLVAKVFERHGRLDLMANNAGVGLLGEVRDMEPAHWRRVLEVNLHGVVNGVQAAYPRMVWQGSGRILNMASLAGLVPAPTGVAYATAKHAVVGLSLSLRPEARAHGVSVTVACPGFVKTGFGDAVDYLRVERERLFPPKPEDRARTRAVAARLLRGTDRGRAVVTTPAWVGWAWRLWRLSPALWDGLVARAVVRRHLRLRD